MESPFVFLLVLAAIGLGIVVLSDLAGHWMDRRMLKREGRIVRRQRGPAMPHDANVAAERFGEMHGGPEL